MIKKLLMVLIIIITSYLLIVFNIPNLASNIEKTIGISGLGDKIKTFKNISDSISTNIPSKEKIETTYDEAYSGAIDIKNTIIKGTNITKNKIDDIRESVEDVEETYNEIKDGIEEIKDGYHKAKDFIEANSGKINEINDVIDNISETTEIFMGTGITINTGSTNTGNLNETNTGIIN